MDENNADIEMDHGISNANTVYGLDHVTNIMKFHSAYLEDFLSLQEFIIYREGPLPIQYRHYIAIMAAGRHKCTYLINFHKKQFLEHNGDANWLKGLSHVPRKLRNLYEINKILAHRPWLVTKEDIQKVVKGPNSWSMSDLGHALVLLVHFHSLCSFVFASNLNDEIPRAVKVTSVYLSPGSKPFLRGYADDGLEPIVERMKKLSEPASEQERIQRYELVQSQLCDSDTSADNGLDPDVKPFVEDSGYSYLDCSRRQFAQQSSFILQEFSWDHHGYELTNRLFNDIGLLLDKKFKTAYNMTYYTMGGRPHIDTSRFRRAIWNYIYCIYGMRNDDCDYEDVTQLLQCQLRVFVKTATCYPERLNKTTTENALKHFELSEKIHINLMIMEARMQAELLFALRAVMNYMMQ
ncbi:sestrin homolog isoform X1 [Myzus persicae]|uniref:sestrin homolog isoform X1 n=2 Tax=Myzus persicae TaxID=13164 RepID=UPI000B931105|nr:sestrin homolog isoform X1 [Myzus persicae]